jgi:germacradienol/geosmin synthase
MASFKAPNFYMPYVARTNPNVPDARVHCKGWAHAVGILGTDGDDGGESVWDESAFDAMDFALFAGQTHPDVPPNELDLLADWYVWGWYMDDLYDTQSKDLAASRDYLARLMAFMPEDPAVPVPGSANAMERALADLWPRTAPSMSPSWRRRYVETITAFADEMLREIFVVRAVGQRILDPIEYVTTRRATSGLQWSAALVEHSLRAEVPPILMPTRALEVLTDSFIDSVALRNDIVSYDNDVRDRKINNAVAIMSAFLDGTIQEAVDVVNDLVTSRLVQFETTAAVELEPVLGEHGLDAAGRSDVWRYVRGLQDWMAGIRKWESRPGGRYAPAASSDFLASRCVGACDEDRCRILNAGAWR